MSPTRDRVVNYPITIMFFKFLPSELRVLQSFTLNKHLPRDEVIKENSFHDEGANFAADHRLNAADADEVRL